MTSSPTPKRRTHTRHTGGADTGPFAASDFETARAGRGTVGAVAVPTPSASGLETRKVPMEPLG